MIVAAGSVVTHDIPNNSVAAGVPAKVIGSFEQFLEKRKISDYPKELSPRKQEVSEELVSFMWNKFQEQRERK